jgi:uncharacterized protein with HEPN domain
LRTCARPPGRRRLHCGKVPQQDYLDDRLLRRAVERSFEIVGEALSQLRKIDEPMATSISDYRKIIGFRNVLIHGYGTVDDELTWSIVEHDLPVLRRELDALLA